MTACDLAVFLLLADECESSVFFLVFTGNNPIHVLAIQSVIRMFSCRWVPEERLKHCSSHSQRVYSSTPTRDESFSDLDVSDSSLLDESISEPSLRPVSLWQR